MVPHQIQSVSYTHLEAQTAYIYSGSFQRGWENSSRTILTQETALRVEKPKNLAFLKEVTQERGLAFNRCV